MSIRRAIISTALGCLCSSVLAAGAQADEIKDTFHNPLYGKITGFTPEGVIFNQNCGSSGKVFPWSELAEARFSGDCQAAKSWRGGGDPPCEWISDPKAVVAMEVMPEVVPMVNGNPVPLPRATATEILGQGGGKLRYRDICTGAEKTIPTGDLVMLPVDGYCSFECK